MNTRKLITAKTTLHSWTGKPHSFLFQVLLTDTGFKKARILKQGKCSIRPWILLDLLIEVLGDELSRRDVQKIQFVENETEYTLHPALEIKDTGLRYRLDQEISISWIYNPDILDLAAYWKQFRPCFKKIYNKPVHKWLYWVEDV